MAYLRSTFHYRLNELWVAADTLGCSIEFRREGYKISVRMPANDTDFGLGGGKDFEYRTLSGSSSGTTENPRQHLGVSIIRVVVWGYAPVGASDFDGSDNHEAFKIASEYLKKASLLAEAIVGELIDWARIRRDQAWLALHGERPERVWLSEFFDEDARVRIPIGVGETFKIHARGRSIDPAFWASLSELLGDGRQNLPVAETLLADAKHLLQADPPDLLRAVLIAAIACEVKVKETLRSKVAAHSLDLVEVILNNPRDVSVATSNLLHKTCKAALGCSLCEDNKKLYRRIEKLFTTRNKIAHGGHTPSEAEARDVVKAADEAFDWLDMMPKK